VQTGRLESFFGAATVLKSTKRREDEKDNGKGAKKAKPNGAGMGKASGVAAGKGKKKK
jgi:hypothetical protein